MAFVIKVTGNGTDDGVAERGFSDRSRAEEVLVNVKRMTPELDFELVERDAVTDGEDDAYKASFILAERAEMVRDILDVDLAPGEDEDA